MSKNHQSWGQPKRDPIKDLENYKEQILKQALKPREPLLIGLKTYEFLQANYPNSNFFNNCEVITWPEPEPNQQ